MSNNNQKCRFPDLSLMPQPIWIGVLLILLLSNSISASGILDPNFGNGGKVNFAFVPGSSIFPGSDNFARAAALQPDGKIVLAGTTAPSGQSNGFRNFAVARLNANGALDNTFGNGGLVTTDFNNNEDVADAVAIQPDGKIIVGGTRQTIQSHSSAFALARYNANGSLDTTFNGGKVVTDFEESLNEAITHLLIQSDGKIIAVGSYIGNSPGPPEKIALVRYNIDGTLDLSFGNNGKFTILFPRFTQLGGAALQPDGKILITGYYVFQRPGCIPQNEGTGCDTDQSFLLRYTPQMTLDKKFGRRFGKEFTKPGSTDRLFGISLQSDGRILASGAQVVKRYTNNGRLETIFDEATFSNRSFRIHQLAQRPDGKIAGCGQLVANGYDDIAVALFNTDGRLIGSDQRDFFGGNDSCNAILTQPDGKIIVVGSAQLAPQSAYNFAVIRYLDITP